MPSVRALRPCLRHKELHSTARRRVGLPARRFRLMDPGLSLEADQPKRIVDLIQLRRIEDRCQVTEHALLRVDGHDLIRLNPARIGSDRRPIQ